MKPEHPPNLKLIASIKRAKKLIISLAATTGVALLLLSLSFLAFMYFKVSGPAYPDTSTKLGELGDFFGGLLNPILSFLAFFILIKTLDQQKEAGLAAERSHEETLETQRFFGLISLTHESARGVEIEFPTSFITPKPNKDNGKQPHSKLQNHLAIGYAWDELKSQLPDLHKEPQENNYSEAYLIKRKIYKKWRKSVWQWIGSYFETVLYILQKHGIPEQISTNNAKIDLTRIMRHQMTTSERNILFYEMLSSRDYHIYMSQLQKVNFWRGGGDGLDDHRPLLIAQAEEHFKKAEAKNRLPSYHGLD